MRSFPILFALAPLALWLASQAARELRDDVVGATHDAGLHRDKEAADVLDIYKSQYSEGLALGNPGPGIWRFANYGLGWWLAFLRRRAARFGQQVVPADALVITNTRHAELFVEAIRLGLQRTQALDAVRVRMVKADLEAGDAVREGTHG